MHELTIKTQHGIRAVLEEEMDVPSICQIIKHEVLSRMMKA
jgi:hypothetical protein